MNKLHNNNKKKKQMEKLSLNTDFGCWILRNKINKYSSDSVVLVLLDLSAAFDTVDHSILISRLESLSGFSHFYLTENSLSN